jgi:murein tripeptide amidase MpaA
MRAFLAGLLSVVAFGRVSYEGQQILNCRLSDDSTAFNKLQEEIDVQGVHPGRFVDVRVQKPSDFDYIKQYTTACEVVVPDLEAKTQEFEALNNEARKSAEWFDAYHNYEEILSWFSDLARQYPSLLTWNASVGKTLEGRDLPALHLFDGSRGGRPTARIFWTGQIHAREWISGATVQYIVNQLALDFSRNDPTIVQILSQLEIIVLPIVNPDGYAWTWAAGGDRQWRKNRRRNVGVNVCYGVDQNRNYNDHWGQGGSSTNPCSDTYMGESPASELEVQAVQNYFLAHQVGLGAKSAEGLPILGAIDWHSYSQLILRPYGWTSAVSPDDYVLKPLGDNYSTDVYNMDGKYYTSQPSIDLYVTTGSASDWYYGTQARAGSPHPVASYTIELRPANQAGGGFLLPPREIIPTGIENYEAIRNWLTYLLNNPLPDHS